MCSEKRGRVPARIWCARAEQIWNAEPFSRGDDEEPRSGLRQKVHGVYNNRPKAVPIGEGGSYASEIATVVRTECTTHVLEDHKSGCSPFSSEHLYQVPKHPECT